MARLGNPIKLLRQTSDWRADCEAEEADLKALQETSDNVSDGEVEGVMIRFQRGDGYAIYVVSKASPLTLSHVEVGDAWQVEDALIRGLREEDILDMHRRDMSLRTLFARKP